MKQQLGSALQDDPLAQDPYQQLKVLSQPPLDLPSSEVEQRACKLIQMASFGLDFEQHIDFLCHCRAQFHSFPSCVRPLVERALFLIQETQRRVLRSGRHTDKTLAFVKCALAYCTVTIPSMEDPSERIQLFNQSAVIAWQNGCLSHSDTLIRASIEGLMAIPKDDSHVMVACFTEILGCCMVLPTPSEKTPLYLVRALYNAARHFDWPPSDEGRFTCLLNMMTLLSYLCQHEYPHSKALKKFDQPSNDAIYAGDHQFRALMDQLQSEILAELLDFMDLMNQKMSAGSIESGLLIDVALGMAEQLILFCELDEVLMKLTARLMALVHKYIHSNSVSDARPSGIAGRAISTRQAWFDLLISSIRSQSEPNMTDLEHRSWEDRMSALEQWKRKPIFAALLSRLRRVLAVQID